MVAIGSRDVAFLNLLSGSTKSTLEVLFRFIILTQIHGMPIHDRSRHGYYHVSDKEEEEK